MLYDLEAHIAHCCTRWGILGAFTVNLNQFGDYLRFMLPSASQLICCRVRKIKGILSLFLVTFSNADTESLNYETQLGDATYDSLRVGVHTKNEED